MQLYSLYECLVLLFSSVNEFLLNTKITDIIADISLDSNEIEDKNPCERIENEGVGSTERVTEITTDIPLHEVDDRDSQDSSSIEKVQKEWTWEVCDVKNSSESVFQSQLQGKRCKVACQVLKSKSRSTTGEQGTCSICQTVITTRKDMIQRKANCELLKTRQSHGYATSVAVPMVLCNSSQHELGTAKSCTSNEIKNNQWWCSLCNISCSNKGNMDDHLNGSKHLEKIKKLDRDGDTGKTAAMPKLRAEPKDVVAVAQIENEVSVVEVEDRVSQDSSTFEEVQKPIDSVIVHGYATSDILPKVPCNLREQKQGTAESGTTKEIKNQHWRCVLCNVSCSSKEQLDSYLNGCKHLVKIKKLHEDGTIGKPTVIPKLKAEKKQASKQDDSANERCQKQTKQVLVCWQFPEPGWIKVNVDGSVRKRKAGCGGVFRNDIGDWMLGFAQNIGSSSVTGAELWGIYTALDLARKWRFSNICVESDSLVAINLVTQGCDKTHPQATIVHDITRILMSSNIRVSFQHTLREGNRVADWLANWSLDKDVGVHEVWSPPDECRAILTEDCMGVAFLRRVKV